MSLASLEGFFKHLSTDAQNFLTKVFGASAISAVEAELKTILEGDAKTIFADGVQFAETVTGGSAAKQSAAFSKITADLKTAGISLGTSAVNLGIELFVGLLQGKAA